MQIISTPHILTLDNEEANIEVGQRVPFQRGAIFHRRPLAHSRGLPAVGRLGQPVPLVA